MKSQKLPGKAQMLNVEKVRGFLYLDKRGWDRKAFIGAMLVVLVFSSCHSGEPKPIGEEDRGNDRTWSVNKADANSSNFSPLNQIIPSNVADLTESWTFEPDDLPKDASPGNSECIPIIIDGVMYVTSAKQLTYALDAATGKQLWKFDPFNGRENEGILSRGASYWESGNDRRILVTGGQYLYALNARTGKPVPSFGDSGKVFLNQGLRDKPERVFSGPTSPGVVYKDLIVFGTQVSEIYGSSPGYMRAYDCRSGKLVWTFHTLPNPGEAGYDTWPQEAYKYSGGCNDWAGLSIDQKRGIVYAAIGSPSYDFFGADRTGDNLYSDCVLALDANTGKHIWHYQMVHHDMWDYDPPAPPALVQLKRDGKMVDAVAQITKQGFVFILDRETGKPLFPIEERPVPASLLPGEKASPTQPFPVLPKPFARQLLSEADLTNYSSAGHDSILKKFRSLRYEGLYTPPDRRGTLQFPGTRGGGEWGGAAYDPSTNFLYIKSNDAPDIQTIIEIDQKQELALSKTPAYATGKMIYITNCASCHREDKGGKEPNFPSMQALKFKMSRDTALDKIRHAHKGLAGADYDDAIKGKEKELMTFVYDAVLSDINKGQTKTDEQIIATERFLNTTGYKTFKDPDGNPAIRPPWGMLHALNLSTGEYKWQQVFGNEEQWQQKGAPVTGGESKGGPMLTAGGVLFISGTKDNKLKAIDKTSGRLLWETSLPALANTTPCTYTVKGKQYIAICLSGTEKHPSGSVVAFALR